MRTRKEIFDIMRWDNGRQMSVMSASYINVRILPARYSATDQQVPFGGGQNSDLYDHLTHIITHILLSCHALRVRVCCT